MANSQILEQISELENELQKLKLVSITSLKSSTPTINKSIVETTSGLLGKNFPSGVVYERKARKEWDKRIKKLGL